MSEAVPESWRAALEPVLQAPEARRLGGWLMREEADGKTVYPPRGQRLRALELTPLDEVKVVILGQDPYHGRGQAHGLCFSVPEGIAVPPSLICTTHSRSRGVMRPIVSVSTASAAPGANTPAGRSSS